MTIDARALDYAREMLCNQRDMGALAKKSCVLFADLVGLSEFKRHHTQREALDKTLVHNAVVTDAIRNLGGDVIKYLTGGVLGVFVDDNAAERAIQAGLQILVGIDTANQAQHWLFPKEMSTKIGIAWGEVWTFSFPESTENDLQGLAVDIACRLVDLASSQQLICTDEAYQEATRKPGGASSFPNSDPEPTARLVRGLHDPINLRVIAPEGKERESIKLAGHPRAIPDWMHRKIDEARNAYRIAQNGKEEQIDAAIRAFSEVVYGFRDARGDVIKGDPGNFEANVRAAELLLHRSRYNKPGIQGAALEEVIKHLSLAKQTRPDSPHSWLLACWTRFKRFELQRNPDDLVRAVDFAETAKNAAEKILDSVGTLLAKTYLARMLLARAEWSADDVASANDIAAAAKYCGEVQEVIRHVQGKRLAQYLVTHVLVRLAQGESDYDGIEKMITEAKEVDPTNSDLEHAYAKLRDARTAILVK
ncbi:MAG: adenylate/guanylate cyclase domain-containing protein [Planctomycetes bacterium]|nr:adenylate/guanylate cyclase domain-containing protein [Planctomycetota bacterium]